MIRRISIVIMVLVLGSGAALAQDAARGERAFLKCRACHAVGPGAQSKAGPVLNGIVGRQAASVPGFKYSEAFQNARQKGVVWTEEQLSAFLETPLNFIPKNRMAFGGITDRGERADIIAYLKTVQ